MTFAEIVLFILMALGIVFLLSPLQKFLEKHLYKFFRKKSSGSGPIIDVTPTSEKEKRDGKS
jgi:predicted PurR-regulated permease PerM